MTPVQLLGLLNRGELAPGSLVLGPEAYERRRVRDAIGRAALAGEPVEDGLSQYDLAESSLSEVLDDARSLSLFAVRRLIYAGNAEAALPRARVAAGGDDEEQE